MSLLQRFSLIGGKALSGRAPQARGYHGWCHRRRRERSIRPTGPPMPNPSEPDESRTEGPPAPSQEQAPKPHTIVVAPDVPMVSLLGPADELLRTIEHAFPRVDVLVRGNEITVTGPIGEVALLER